MSDAIIISCFDRTGNMVRPWAEAGFTCYCVDTRHEPGDRHSAGGSSIRNRISPEAMEKLKKALSASQPEHPPIDYSKDV